MAIPTIDEYYKYPVPDQPGLEVTPQHLPLPEIVTRPVPIPDAFHNVRGDFENEQISEGEKEVAVSNKRCQGGENPFGLSPLVYGLLIFVPTIIIVGVAVGAGVGTACRNKTTDTANTRAIPSATSIVTVASLTVTAQGAPTAGSTSYNPADTASLPPPSSLSNYLVFEPEYISTLSNPCASLPDPYPGPNGDLYTKKCANAQLSSGLEGAGGIINIVGTLAYSMQDCIWACSTYNAQLHVWQTQNLMPRCRAVTWAQNFADKYTQYNANCFLKNGSWDGKPDSNSASFVLQE